MQIDPSRNPLFDTMLIFHNELESLNNFKFGNLELKHYEIEHHTSKLDFKLDVYSSIVGGNSAGSINNDSGELNCILEYNVDLFTGSDHGADG